MGKKAKKLVVEIEVGGDHGDGNVEVIRKSKGVQLIIRDFDNARLDEKNPDGDTIPATRNWGSDVSV